MSQSSQAHNADLPDAERKANPPQATDTQKRDALRQPPVIEPADAARVQDTASETADIIERELARRARGLKASAFFDVDTSKLPSMLTALRGPRVSAPADAAPAAPIRGPECEGRAYLAMLRGLSNPISAPNAVLSMPA